MSAKVYEASQFSASCSECRWYGEVYDNQIAEQLAEEDRNEHNQEFHQN